MCVCADRIIVLETCAGGECVRKHKIEVARFSREQIRYMHNFRENHPQLCGVHVAFMLRGGGGVGGE